MFNLIKINDYLSSYFLLVCAIFKTFFYNYLDFNKKFTKTNFM